MPKTYDEIYRFKSANGKNLLAESIGTHARLTIGSEDVLLNKNQWYDLRNLYLTFKEESTDEPS